jgi:hypothetical protein
MNSNTISIIFQAAAGFGKLLFDAFTRGDQAEIRRLSAVLDQPLQSSVVKAQKDEEARARLGG